MASASEVPRRPLEVVVLGAINWDTTVFEAKFASPGEEVPVSRVEEFPGGKGANAAAAAARILGRGSVAFLGALGHDAVRGPLLESLSTEGVRTEGVVTVRGKASGRAIIVVDGAGQKTIHTHFGANDAYEPKHVRSQTASAILSAAPMAVVMDVPLPAAKAALSAGPRPSRVVYSPGVRAAEAGPLVDEVVSLADDLVVDRSELARLSGAESPRDGVESLVRRYEGVTVVATLGPDGCLVAKEGKTASVPPVDLADLGLSAVNSTGSGDAFLAAYSCYALFGLPPAEAAAWGNLAGALKAASAETRGSPTRGVLEETMRALREAREPRLGSR